MMVYIPYTSHTNAYGHPVTSDVISRLYDLCIIILHGEINSTLASSICAQLLCLSHDKPNRTVKIIINSPGGEVYSAMGIVDIMLHMKQDVFTHVIGLAASAATVIASAGKARDYGTAIGGAYPAARYASQFASFMIHQPMGKAEGQATEINIYLNEIMRLRKQLAQLYCRFSRNKFSIDDFEKMIERDTWMDAEKALELGLIDAILA